jgi:hypothetical protein
MSNSDAEYNELIKLIKIINKYDESVLVDYIYSNSNRLLSAVMQNPFMHVGMIFVTNKIDKNIGAQHKTLLKIEEDALYYLYCVGKYIDIHEKIRQLHTFLIIKSSLMDDIFGVSQIIHYMKNIIDVSTLFNTTIHVSQDLYTPYISYLFEQGKLETIKLLVSDKTIMQREIDIAKLNGQLKVVEYFAAACGASTSGPASSASGGEGS